VHELFEKVDGESTFEVIDDDDDLDIMKAIDEAIAEMTTGENFEAIDEDDFISADGDVGQEGGLVYDICLTTAFDEDDLDVNALGDGIERTEPKGTRMDATLDSGAGASVMNPAHAPDYEVEESPGSLSGQHYVGLGGERIPNKGQMKIGIQLMDGANKRVTFQAATVRKTLLAVSNVCDKRQFCIFDNDGSYICPRDTPEGQAILKLVALMKHKISVQRKGGVYVLPTWIKLAADSGFHRQA